MKIDDIRQAMIAAMKAHDKPRKEAVSALLEAIKKVAIDSSRSRGVPSGTARSMSFLTPLPTKRRTSASVRSGKPQLCIASFVLRKRSSSVSVRVPSRSNISSLFLAIALE